MSEEGKPGEPGHEGEGGKGGAGGAGGAGVPEGEGGKGGAGGAGGKGRDTTGGSAGTGTSFQARLSYPHLTVGERVILVIGAVTATAAFLLRLSGAW